MKGHGPGVRGVIGMDTERLLEIGERGLHLLFDTEAIHEAFGQDARTLRRALDGRQDEIEFALGHLAEIQSVEQGRRFIGSLPPPVRHVVVLLYFELLDGRLRRHRVLH
jgi:hypothetical protein